MREQLRRYLVREYDYRTGELIDQSPNAITTSPTATSASWATGDKGRGVYTKAVGSKLDYGAVDYIGTGARTFVAIIRPDGWGGTNVGRIIDNGKLLLNTSVTSTRIRLCSDGSTAAYSAAGSINLGQTYIIVVTRDASGLATFYINGVQSGTRNQPSGTPTAASTNTFISGGTGNTGLDGINFYTAVYDRLLTEQQIAQLSDELMTEKSVTLPAVRTQSDVNLLADGSMEWADTSFFGTVSATLSKQAGASVGTQCLRVVATAATSYATQSILTLSKFYRVTGSCRGDGTNVPKVAIGSTSAVNVGTSSNTWQRFDLVRQCLGNAIFYLGSTSSTVGNYVEFDDIKVVEIPALTAYQPLSYPAYICGNGTGWNRSFANETSGELSNTGFRIITSGFQVENAGHADKRRKQITVKVTGGNVVVPYSGMPGYWKFSLYKSADASITRVYLMETLPGDYTVSGNQGYLFQLSNNEAVYFYSFTGGTPTSRMNTAASYIATTGWYDFVVKRYPGGVWYFWIKGGAFTNWTLISPSGGAGTNPVTNNTYTTGNYIGFIGSANDAIKDIEVSPNFNQLLINNNF